MIRIKSVRVRLEAFADLTSLELKPGVNILTGANNSGKTRLLRGIGSTWCDLTLVAEKRTLWSALQTQDRPGGESERAHFDAAKDSKELTEFGFCYEKTPNGTTAKMVNKYGYFGLYGYDLSTWEREDRVREQIRRIVKSEVMLVPAERLPSRQWHHEMKPEGAQNVGFDSLGHELAKLQSSSPTRYERIIELTRVVLPDVQFIQPSEATRSKQYQLRLSHVGKEDYESRSFSLGQVGVGTGHVIGLLYVLVSQNSSVFLLDEPLAFLHPGAQRRLISVVTEMAKSENKQFIIATNNIEAFKPWVVDSWHHLSRLNDEVEVTASSPEDLSTFYEVFGVTAQEVFSASRILWVEGPTEAACLPLILAETFTRHNVSIVPVFSTGRFDAAHVAETIGAYEKLAGQQWMPPAMFLFDRENKSSAQVSRLERQHDALRFIQADMFEAYLLCPDAISELLNHLNTEAEAGLDPKTLSPERVKTIIDREEHNSSAKRIAEVFSELSSAKFEYRKVEYGKRLVDITLKLHGPDHFAELIAPVNEWLSEANSGP